MTKCCQCDKPAYVGDLCVDHFFKLQVAQHNQLAWLASHLNLISEKLDQGTGYLVTHARMQIPHPPHIGESMTKNYINVTDSVVGVINTGTISNLNSGIAVAESQGQKEIAIAITEFAQAVINSEELINSVKDEITEQLDFILTQVTAEPDLRRTGLIKSALVGIGTAVGTCASLLTLWEKLQALLQTALGM